MPDKVPKLTADDLNKAMDKLRGKAPGTTGAAGGDVADVLKRDEDAKMQSEMAGAESQVESAPASVPSPCEPAPVAVPPAAAPAADAAPVSPPVPGEYADEWMQICDGFAAYMEGYIAEGIPPDNPTQTAISLGRVVQGSTLHNLPGMLARAIRVATHSDKRDEAVNDCMAVAKQALKLAFDCVMWRGQQNAPGGRPRVVQPKVMLPRNADGTVNLSPGAVAVPAAAVGVPVAPAAPVAAPPPPRGLPPALTPRLEAKRVRFPRNADGSLALGVPPVAAPGRVVQPKFMVPRDANGNVSIPVPPLPPPQQIRQGLEPKK